MQVKTILWQQIFSTPTSSSLQSFMPMLSYLLLKLSNFAKKINHYKWITILSFTLTYLTLFLLSFPLFVDNGKKYESAGGNSPL